MPRTTSNIQQGRAPAKFPYIDLFPKAFRFSEAQKHRHGLTMNSCNVLTYSHCNNFVCVFTTSYTS